MSLHNDVTASIASRDLNLLFGLRVLLEESNVTRAAARMGIGQPGMSAILARLRTHYGDELLARFGRDYELTPLGRVLLPQVQEATALIERSLGIAPRAFDPAHSERAFTILAAQYGGNVVQAAITRVVSLAPGIRVDLITGTEDVDTGSRREWLDHDLVVSSAPGPAEYRSMLLRRDRYVCVADRASSALADGRVRWEDSDTTDFVVGLGAGPEPSAMLHQALANHGHDIQAALTVDGLATVTSIVRGTDMVGLVPQTVADLFARDDDVVVDPLPFSGPVLSSYLSWHSSRDADPGLQWIVETMTRRDAAA
ncbi:MAG: LysR family transcriptional regulator [Microbacterium sp.]|uniref:LysR family transcriptional regulator n=1 Tax=Microbacterium sp. TaxID=51671 RepID=UPI0039E6C1EC